MNSPILNTPTNRSIQLACLTGIVAIVTGCATQSQTQASIGIGLGCGMGAVLATAMGKNAGEGCVLGAAVGGTVGYLKGRQADLELARAAAQDIQRTATTNSSGTTVQVNTRAQSVPANERAAMGNASQIETVDKMVVNVPKSLVARRDLRAAETFSRVGRYVSTASAPSVVTVKADNKSEFEYIVSQIKGGYSAGKLPAANQVEYKFEQSLQRASQTSVEVAHSA